MGMFEVLWERRMKKERKQPRKNFPMTHDYIIWHVVGTTGLKTRRLEMLAMHMAAAMLFRSKEEYKGKKK